MRHHMQQVYKPAQSECDFFFARKGPEKHPSIMFHHGVLSLATCHWKALRPHGWSELDPSHLLCCVVKPCAHTNKILRYFLLDFLNYVRFGTMLNVWLHQGDTLESMTGPEYFARSSLQMSVLVCQHDARIHQLQTDEQKWNTMFLFDSLLCTSVLFGPVSCAPCQAGLSLPLKRNSQDSLQLLDQYRKSSFDVRLTKHTIVRSACQPCSNLSWM